MAWLVGDYVRIQGEPDRMTVSGFIGPLALCYRDGYQVLAQPETLEAAPYQMRQGIVYDGDTPVGVMPGAELKVFVEYHDLVTKRLKVRLAD